MTVTNRKNLPLELAVWVLYNDYDLTPAINTISATGLMKPLRQTILASRVVPGQGPSVDVEDLVPSAMGRSLHSSVELAWRTGDPHKIVQSMGYSAEMVKRLLVNPTTEQLAATKDPIVIYVEQRASKMLQVSGIQVEVSGRFDLVCEGRVTDIKSTSVYSWIMGNKDDDYRMQMSIYRWMNPDKITDDFGRINYIFTDWSKLDAKRRRDYPPDRIMSKQIQLLSVEDTEAWISERIQSLIKYQHFDEKDLPECTPEELWMSPPTFKYYASSLTAERGGRSSRNFDSLEDAESYRDEKGKGVVITAHGTPKRCGYCNVYSLCTQKDRYDYD